MHRSLLLFVALAAQLALSERVHGQVGGWLPYHHWTHREIVRLHALGVLPLHDPVRVQQWAPAVLVHESPLPAWPRLEEERAGTLHPGLHVTLAGEYVVRDGAVRTGRFTPERAWQPPAAIADITAPGARAHVRVQATDALSLTAHAAGYGSDYRVEQLTADAQLGRAHVWGGRRALGFTAGVDGGLVLTRLPRLDGAGVAVSPRAALQGELFTGRVASNGRVRTPWLLGMRVHAAPHTRFDMGITRVAIFGSMSDDALGVREIGAVLIAANLEPPYADDQVASIDARWRVPFAHLPLELYGEWGVHDIDPGVFIDMPAFTAGVRLPALPRAPALSATLEHTQVSGSCCLNPPWYHHFELADNWSMRGEPLGHPLGGHGREWLIALAATTAPVLAHVSAAWRTRNHENLYAPTRSGRSLALHAAADAQLRSRMHLTFDLTSEHADAWREVRARGTLQLRF